MARANDNYATVLPVKPSSPTVAPPKPATPPKVLPPMVPSRGSPFEMAGYNGYAGYIAPLDVNPLYNPDPNNPYDYYYGTNSFLPVPYGPPVPEGFNAPAAPAGSGGSGGSGYGGGGGYGYGYGGGGGGAAPAPEVTWSAFDYAAPGAPTWWKAMKPSDMADAASEYLAELNMLIPYLSPEDQITAAQTIYQMNGRDFAHLAPDKIKPPPRAAGPQPGGIRDATRTWTGAGAEPTEAVKAALSRKTLQIPTEITGDLRNQYTAAERSSNALAALSALAGAVGKTAADLGPGYRYLQTLLTTGQTFGAAPGNGQTRGQYQQMLAALDPLYGQTKSGSLAPYGSLARMLSQPFFSAGQLMPYTKAQDGSYIFGTPNKELY